MNISTRCMLVQRGFDCGEEPPEVGRCSSIKLQVFQRP